MFYIYLLRSLRNGKSYVGFTAKDPKERLEEHNNGTNEFTRNNRPWELVYYETFTCKNCATEREKFFKIGVGKKLRQILLDHFKTGASSDSRTHGWGP